MPLTMETIPDTPAVLQEMDTFNNEHNLKSTSTTSESLSLASDPKYTETDFVVAVRLLNVRQGSNACTCEILYIWLKRNLYALVIACKLLGESSYTQDPALWLYRKKTERVKEEEENDRTI